MDDILYLYLYRTARDDGMQFCVGARRHDGPSDGMVALFQTHHAAMVFVDAMHAKYGVEILVMPSAEVGA